MVNSSKQPFNDTQRKGFITYNITPRDHRSAVWLYGCSRTNSGAMYRGVPYMNLKAEVKKVCIEQLFGDC